jgi:hypothetical protein
LIRSRLNKQTGEEKALLPSEKNEILWSNLQDGPRKGFRYDDAEAKAGKTYPCMYVSKLENGK